MFWRGKHRRTPPMNCEVRRTCAMTLLPPACVQDRNLAGASHRQWLEIIMRARSQCGSTLFWGQPVYNPRLARPSLAASRNGVSSCCTVAALEHAILSRLGDGGQRLSHRTTSSLVQQGSVGQQPLYSAWRWGWRHDRRILHSSLLAQFYKR